MLVRIPLLGMALSLVTMPPVALAGDPMRPIDFDRDVQPILSARCVKCHGPGGGEGGLRLTEWNAASVKLQSGKHAILPGRPDESELLRRIASTDEADRMPPDGPPLKPEQIGTLRRWISEGAAWPAHWAYRPLVRPAVPAVDSEPEFAEWPRTVVDRFVLASLRERKLAPSPPADRRTLLRRVTIDLTGLPPAPADVDAFLADPAPDAYERVVERLLSSPHYGERWARHWMDLVHYAETHGHDQDSPREHAWPYRDYLIRSLNEDKPYARFIEEQIAGDVMFPEDPRAIAATGFLATGAWDESSLKDIQENTLDREIARYLDRDDIVTTVMSTFVSSTAHCARCHDHKFDPIPQIEYYALQAVFAGTDKANRAYDPDPALAARRRSLIDHIASVPELKRTRDASLLDPAFASQVAAWEASVRASNSTWQLLDPAEFTSSGGATLTRLDDGSILSAGVRPEKDTVTVTVNSGLKTITALMLEVLTDERLPLKGPGRQDNGNLHLSEILVHAAPRGNPAGKVKLVLQNPRADFNQQAWEIDRALDGRASTAWGIYPEVGKPHFAVFELKEPFRSDSGVTLTIELQQLHGGGHLIGRARLLATELPLPLPNAAEPLPPPIAAITDIASEKRTDDQRIEIAAHYLDRKLRHELESLPKQQQVYCGTSQFVAIGSFRPSTTPRVIHLLGRGEITKKGPEVGPGTLSCVPGLEGGFSLPPGASEGERRAALARWVSDPKNVLTWRSIANRVWQHHFGRGLVDTPNDFGRMGGVPTHPELLDWLATELQGQPLTTPSPPAPPGGIPETRSSLKRLHRLIVTSSTYRQSSAFNEAAALIDADNHYLWRMNRQRLDAETVRDAVLQAADRLDTQMEGPSVKQFIQTPGIHVTPNVDYQNFSVDDPANQRRSIYRFLFRTLPDPFMDTLDCPDASQLTPKRTTSVTALQALAMWNDKFIVRQSEHLADRVTAAGGSEEARIRELYRRILGRAATDRESKAIAAYAAKHGWANAARVLLNSNEFLFVD